MISPRSVASYLSHSETKWTLNWVFIPGCHCLPHMMAFLPTPAMSREQTESVVKTVETLLAEAEQLKNHCRRQNEDIKLIMEELQRENRDLAQNYERAEHEMEEMRKALGELLDTKIAFEARERQVRKLSKQL